MHFKIRLTILLSICLSGTALIAHDQVSLATKDKVVKAAKIAWYSAGAVVASMGLVQSYELNMKTHPLFNSPIKWLFPNPITDSSFQKEQFYNRAGQLGLLGYSIHGLCKEIASLVATSKNNQ